MNYVKIDESNPNRLTAQVSILLKDYDYRAKFSYVDEEVYKDLYNKYTKIYDLLNSHPDMKLSESKDMLIMAIFTKLEETSKFLKLEKNLGEYDLKNKKNIQKIEYFVRMIDKFKSLLIILKNNVQKEEFKNMINKSILEIENMIDNIYLYFEAFNGKERLKYEIRSIIIFFGIIILILILLSK